MKRYPATIALAVMLTAVLALLVWRVGEYRECKRDGGVYASTFVGWECVR